MSTYTYQGRKASDALDALIRALETRIEEIRGMRPEAVGDALAELPDYLSDEIHTLERAIGDLDDRFTEAVDEASKIKVSQDEFEGALDDAVRVVDERALLHEHRARIADERGDGFLADLNRAAAAELGELVDEMRRRAP